MAESTHSRRGRRRLLLCGLLAFLLGNGTGFAQRDAKPVPDPTSREVPLPSAPGWHARLLIDNGETGIWTVGAFQIFPEYGVPEVVGLDDAGVCHVLVSYSGKWSPRRVCHDGAWLGGLCFDDLDPRVDGPELYTGGKNGNLYQVTPHPAGTLACKHIAFLPGHEIHTIVAGDLDPRTEGRELVVFTRPGAMYRVTPTGPHGSFVSERLMQLEGRYRDAVVLPARKGQRTRIAGVTRAGRLSLLWFDEKGPHWQVLYQARMGMGRLALRRSRPEAPVVLYAGHDDGRILRFEEQEDGTFAHETIFLGPQGNRGIASGRFHLDPDVETVAVFGYSKKVQILSRKGEGAWQAETIFVDRDKGHWLGVAEFDGRNNTDEIIGSGYGARIFSLSRPPGYGRPGIPTDDAPAPQEQSDPRLGPKSESDSR